jgi:hypothetical protein
MHLGSLHSHLLVCVCECEREGGREGERERLGVCTWGDFRLLKRQGEVGGFFHQICRTLAWVHGCVRDCGREGLCTCARTHIHTCLCVD